MRMGMGAVLLLAVGCAPAMGAAGREPAAATVRFVDAQGRSVGSAVVTEAEQGVRINVNVRGLPPGTHGIHVHENGACDPPGFTTAGAHYNPTGRQHGLENPQGPHLGDLPNLIVGADGAGELEAVSTTLTLRRDNSLLKPGGTALVIHAAADDGRTDPSGNSGARIACGVIEER
jgi:Cu-Zn family superoxide dismutase